MLINQILTIFRDVMDLFLYQYFTHAENVKKVFITIIYIYIFKFEKFQKLMLLIFVLAKN